MPEPTKYRLYNTNSKSYIKIVNSKLVLTKDIVLAHQYTHDKAVNTLEHSGNPVFKTPGWCIKEVVVEEKSSPSKGTPKTYSPSKCMGIDFDEIEKDFEGLSDKIEEFVLWSENLVKEKDKLLTALSKVDQEKADIDHAIEFGTFNACEGYKLSKKLQEIMYRRRVIKDAINLMPCVTTVHGMLSDCYTKLESRTYTPRVLKDVIIKAPKNFINDKNTEEA